MSEPDTLAAALLQIEQLQRALAHRDQIGTAKGMLMMRYALTAEQAFAYLVRRSRDQNVKVHDLASTVIAELSAQTWPGTGGLRPPRSGPS